LDESTSGVLIKFEICRYSSAVVEQLTCNQQVTPLASSIFLSSSCFLDGILRKVSLLEGVQCQEGVNKLRVKQIALLPALFLSSLDLFFAI